MIDGVLIHFIAWSQIISAEWISGLTFIVCALSILGACKIGFAGLCAYNVLAMVAGNIQVLKLCQYSLTHEPVALGTVLFATTFLVSDIITEYYGPRYARISILICFASQLILTLWMLLCLGHKSVQGADQEQINHSIQFLFIPQFRFFIASIAAYVSSQLIDISIYQWLKKKCHRKYLWVRQNIATFISGFIDNFIFSVLAWIVFNPIPMSLRTVFITYIFAGYVFRAVVNFLGTPILYLSKRLISAN